MQPNLSSPTHLRCLDSEHFTVVGCAVPHLLSLHALSLCTEFRWQNVPVCETYPALYRNFLKNNGRMAPLCVRITFFYTMTLRDWLNNSGHFSGILLPSHPRVQSFFQTSGTAYPETQLRIPEEWNPEPNRCQNIKIL